MTIMQRLLAGSLATIVKAFVVPRQCHVDRDSGSFSPPEEEDPELLSYIDRWIEGSDDDDDDDATSMGTTEEGDSDDRTVRTTNHASTRKKEYGSMDAVIESSSSLSPRIPAMVSPTRHAMGYHREQQQQLHIDDDDRDEIVDRKVDPSKSSCQNSMVYTPTTLDNEHNKHARNHLLRVQ